MNFTRKKCCPKICSLKGSLEFVNVPFLSIGNFSVPTFGKYTEPRNISSQNKGCSEFHSTLIHSYPYAGDFQFG